MCRVWEGGVVGGIRSARASPDTHTHGRRYAQGYSCVRCHYCATHCMAMCNAMGRLLPCHSNRPSPHPARLPAASLTARVRCLYSRAPCMICSLCAHTQLPLYALIAFGCYSLANIGYNLFIFRECGDAKRELDEVPTACGQRGQGAGGQSEAAAWIDRDVHGAPSTYA